MIMNQYASQRILECAWSAIHRSNLSQGTRTGKYLFQMVAPITILGMELAAVEMHGK
jgi:hypothetical protein